METQRFPALWNSWIPKKLLGNLLESLLDIKSKSESLNNLDHIELGDIFISLEMALEQSYEYKHSIYREMIWLASHGFLHLLGWEHNNEHDLENMLNFQEYLITRLD